jgi:hypothetical protein
MRMKKTRRTPPATRAPDKGPTMKDMMDARLFELRPQRCKRVGHESGRGGPGRVALLRCAGRVFVQVQLKVVLDWGRTRWSLPKVSTSTSCKSYFPISPLLTLLPSLKLANPSWQARFQDYIARSVSTTIKRRGIQKYATPSRPRVSTPVCCDSCLPEKIVTPFAVVTAHPHLAAHVQAIGRCLSFFRDVEFDLIPL